MIQSLNSLTWDKTVFVCRGPITVAYVFAQLILAGSTILTGTI